MAEPQYLTIKTFGGLNRGETADLIRPDEFIQLDNMWGKPDYSSTQNYSGIVNKAPYRGTSWKTTMPAAGRARGLFQYFPLYSTTSSFLICHSLTTDYSAATTYVLSLAGNSWLTIATAGSRRHMDFEQYESKVYCTNGENGMRKWWSDGASPSNWDAVMPAVRDKGKTAAAIAAATLTWNVTTTVTSDIDVSASIAEGDWIRKSSTSAYWDEVSTIDGAGTTITLIVASSDTGASAAGGAQKAGTTSLGTSEFRFNPYFVKVFKNKLFAARSNGGEGEVTTGDLYSRLYWSVTGDPENWSGVGAGNIDVDHFGADTITGLGVLDDYLFVFKDTKYYVYRWTGDVTLPIELVKTFDYGCISERSIQEVGDTLIYFTGDEVRMTNGSQDVSISTPQLTYEFQTNWKPYLYSYFASSAADNSYPWALYDKERKTYMLFLPGTTSGSCFLYDVEKKMWSGKMTSTLAGAGEMVRDGTTIPTVTTATMTSTNQLKTYHRTTFDYSNGATVFSAPIDFGYSYKKKKIYWVEFVFHPKVGCDTTLKFNYWDFDEDKTTPSAGSADEVTYNLASSGTSVEQRETKRFFVDRQYHKFGWTLHETVGGTEGWGIISVTIKYEIVDNP